MFQILTAESLMQLKRLEVDLLKKSIIFNNNIDTGLQTTNMSGTSRNEPDLKRAQNCMKYCICFTAIRKFITQIPN